MRMSKIIILEHLSIWENYYLLQDAKHITVGLGKNTEFWTFKETSRLMDKRNV